MQMPKANLTCDGTYSCRKHAGECEVLFERVMEMDDGQHVETLVIFCTNMIESLSSLIFSEII